MREGRLVGIADVGFDVGNDEGSFVGLLVEGFDVGRELGLELGLFVGSGMDGMPSTRNLILFDDCVKSKIRSPD